MMNADRFVNHFNLAQLPFGRPPAFPLQARPPFQAACATRHSTAHDIDADPLGIADLKNGFRSRKPLPNYVAFLT